MKKIIYLFFAGAIMASCNNNAKQGTDTKKQMMTDTSALYNNNVNTDTTRAVTTEPVEPSLSTAVKESTMPKETSKPKEAKKSKITTVQPKQQQQANTSEPVATAPVSNDADQTTTDASNGNDASPGATDSKTTTSTTETAVKPQKKGMSNSAKDAIIGGGAGAVGGAIISKKKGKGAIIGGLLGAGAGYILGKNKDKKDTAK